MKFSNNSVTLGIAEYSARLLIGVVSMIGRLTLGVFVIVGRNVLVEGPRIVGGVRWLKAQTTNILKKFHTLIGPHSRGACRMLKVLIIFSLRTLKAKAVPRIIATIRATGGACNGIIVKSTRRRRRDLTQNINKASETLPKDQEENIS